MFSSKIDSRPFIKSNPPITSKSSYPSGLISRKIFRPINDYYLSFLETKEFSSPSFGFYKTKNTSSRHQNIKNWYSQKMSELNKLAENWKDLEIEPPNNLSIYWASECLEYLRKLTFPCDRIAASVDEGVCISFLSKKYQNRYADIEFFNNGEILAAKSDRVSTPEIWQISTRDILKTLKEIREYIES